MPIFRRIGRYSAAVYFLCLPDNNRRKRFFKGINTFDINDLLLFSYYYFNGLFIVNKY